MSRVKELRLVTFPLEGIVLHNRRRMMQQYSDRLHEVLEGIVTVQQVDKIVSLLWPEVVEITEMGSDERVFEAAAPAIASYFASIGSADPNIDFHTGEDGFMQSGALFQLCVAVAAECEPDHLLVGISPEIVIKSRVPLGATCKFTLRRIRNKAVKKWSMNVTCKGDKVLEDLVITLVPENLVR